MEYEQKWLDGGLKGFWFHAGNRMMRRHSAGSHPWAHRWGLGPRWPEGLHMCAMGRQATFWGPSVDRTQCQRGKQLETLSIYIYVYCWIPALAMEACQTFHTDPAAVYQILTHWLFTFVVRLKGRIGACVAVLHQHIYLFKAFQSNATWQGTAHTCWERVMATWRERMMGCKYGKFLFGNAHAMIEDLGNWTLGCAGTYRHTSTP